MTSAEYTGLVPDRLMMEVGLEPRDTEILSQYAGLIAQRDCPKMSGGSARRISGIFGDGWFGVHWKDPHLWFQEAGIRPFTMRNLAGKTIPMWVDDPDGSVQQENPKAETRVTEDGRRQTQIFRKAAPIGSRKQVERNGQVVDVPRSYPGAPGRIAMRELPAPYTSPGKVAGMVAQGNVGVRWRHPGLPRRGFLRNAIIETVETYGLEVGQIRDQFGRFR